MSSPFPAYTDPGPSDFYVYGYFEPGSEKPFYIGKGQWGRDRFHLKHFSDPKYTGLFYARLRELAAKGITPDVRRLHEGLTDSDAREKEIWLIDRYGRIDIGTGCLCNHTRGGEGKSKRKSETPARTIRRAPDVASSVESYDLATGRTVKRYPWIAAALADGFQQSKIADACRGLTKSYGGLGWRYAS
jgi:hypothetical protein